MAGVLAFFVFVAGVAGRADIADLLDRPEDGEKMLQVKDLADAKDKRGDGKVTSFAISEYAYGPFVHSLKSDTNQVEDWPGVGLKEPDADDVLPKQIGGFPAYYQSVRLKHSCAARFWSATMTECGGVADAEFEGDSCVKSMDKAREKDPAVRQQIDSCGILAKIAFSRIEEVFGFSSSPLTAEGRACLAVQTAQVELAMKNLPADELKNQLRDRRSEPGLLGKAACATRLGDKEICDRASGRIAVRLFEFQNVRSATLEKSVARADFGETRKHTDEFKIPVISVNAVLAAGKCRTLTWQQIVKQLKDPGDRP